MINTYNVCAAWAEGKCSTGIDVGGIQELQYSDEIRTVRLETRQNTSKEKQPKNISIKYK